MKLKIAAQVIENGLDPKYPHKTLGSDGLLEVFVENNALTTEEEKEPTKENIDSSDPRPSEPDGLGTGTVQETKNLEKDEEEIKSEKPQEVENEIQKDIETRLEPSKKTEKTKVKKPKATKV